MKIFAAVITSSKRREKTHIDAVKNLEEGLKFSLKVLNIKNLKDMNLYVYVAMTTDNKPDIINWGNYTQ